MLLSKQKLKTKNANTKSVPNLGQILQQEWEHIPHKTQLIMNHTSNKDLLSDIKISVQATPRLLAVSSHGSLSIITKAEANS